MGRDLKSIPKNLFNLPRELRITLEPMIDAIETRFLGNDSRERVVTRDELVRLGLALSLIHI